MENKKDTGYKNLQRDRDKCFEKWGEYMKRAQLAEKKVEKLKSLLLLTDPCVSREIVSYLQIAQWNEFVKAFPEEKL